MGAIACGGSGYQYVQNDDLGVYAKLPDGWTVYDERELLASVGDFESADDPALDRAASQLWFRGFDSSSEPTVEGSFVLDGEEPHGYLQVQPLTAEQREQVNVATLRSLANDGVDPVAAMRQDPTGDIGVLRDEAVEFDGGYHGVHTVFSKSADGGSSVVDQTVVLNSTSSVLFIFIVACDQRCYTQTHKDEIADIVDSWTIQET
jgi:hypothetical protein